MLARLDDSLTDSGPKKSGPERLCVVTREVKGVDDLLRFVVAPDGTVVPDLKRNLPGRGLWITATREVLADAVKRKAFAKGFKQDVRTGEDLIARTDQLARTLRTRCVGHRRQGRTGRGRFHESGSRADPITGPGAPAW